MNHLPAAQSFAVFVRDRAETRCASLEGLRPRATRYEARLVEGTSITGRITPVPEAYWIRIQACRGEVRFTGDVAADGTFRIDALPEGEWELAVHAERGSDDEDITATARAGSPPSATLDLLGQQAGKSNTISYARIRLRP